MGQGVPTLLRLVVPSCVTYHQNLFSSSGVTDMYMDECSETGGGKLELRRR
jgi:hypothetical protein